MKSASEVEPATLPVPAESAEELYEDAPCGYLSLLPDGTIVRANRTFLRWTGYTAHELVSKRRVQDLLPVPAKVFYETHYAPLLRMQGFIREMALDLVCANKQTLPVLVNASEQRDAAGVPVSIRTAVYDATERRTYERELLAARRRVEQLAGVVEASADAIILTDSEGIVVAWNAAAERLFGYTAGEARGRSIRDLILPPGQEEDYDRAVEQLRAHGEMHLETLLAHRNGHTLEVSLSMAPHIEAPGELVGVSSIIRDMTERRLMEKQMRVAEKLQAVGTLAGGVAHEVNNQMTVVLGFGHFVLDALGAEHPVSVDVQQMVAAADRAARITQQLLAFSRQQMMSPLELDLSRLIDELEPALREVLGRQHSLVSSSDLSEARVWADPSQIERVLRHLVRNARAAMDTQGELRITVDRATLTDDDARRHPADHIDPGSYVRLTVSDTGRGMDEETLSRAFEPFFTTRPFGEATGLGLPTAYGIVKQHGGHIWATSGPGEGTTVRVYLPALGPDGGGHT